MYRSVERKATFLYCFVTLASLCSGQGKVEGGHLKWMFEAKNGFSPHDTPFAPAIFRGKSPGDDRVAVLSQTANGNWAVDGLSINSGRRVWDAVLPFTEESQVWPGVFSGNPYQFLENTMNLAFVQVPGVLIAIDGLTGDAKWQWPIPADHSLQGVSGWDGGLGIIMQGQPVTSPYFPAVIRPTVLASLNASDGSVFWLQNATTALPLSQADAASYAVESIEGTKGGLLYSRANKLLLIDWVDGSIIWQTQVSLEGSVGTGQGANVTHVRYIPKHPLSDKPERILLNANNWGFQRFVMMAFNETNTTDPAEPIWRSRFPETSLIDVSMTAPTVDNSPDSEMFYYWANRTNWNVGENPTSETYLVGKKLSDGSEVWSTRLDPIGLPSTYYGRVFVTSAGGLNAIQGNSGSLLWTINGDPSMKYSYGSTPTFSNSTGIMVAVRCMQSDLPTLCMYSAFDPAGSATKCAWNHVHWYGVLLTIYILFML